jgi:glucose-6-phosphate-specific signal transduction histidine kinase
MLTLIKLQLLIIAIWVLLFIFNGAINNLLYHNSYIAIIFIPAGFKITIACLLGKRVFWGLFVGSLITALLFLEEAMIKHALMFALLSAGSPILTIWLVNTFTPLGKKLQNLNLQKILLISVMYSIINSFMHNTYLLMSEGLTFEKYQADSLLMFTGDFLGSLIFLFLLSYYRKGIIRIIHKYI